MKKIYLLLADGFEEVEAFAPYDILYRSGAEIQFVSTMRQRAVFGAHATTIKADILLSDAKKDYDMVIIPGGSKAVETMQSNDAVLKFLESASENGHYIAAICAAPVILANLGILRGKMATCHPSFREKITGAIISQRNVVVDGKIITACAMGSSLEFGLTLSRILFGKDESEKIRAQIVY
ncbi:MAG: DJ-1/PfpI family protein [Clostridia bacterium]